MGFFFPFGAVGMVPEGRLCKTSIAFYQQFRKVLFSKQLEDTDRLPCVVHSTYFWEFCDQSVTNGRFSRAFHYAIHYTFFEG